MSEIPISATQTAVAFLPILFYVAFPKIAAVSRSVLWHTLMKHEVPYEIHKSYIKMNMGETLIGIRKTVTFVLVLFSAGWFAVSFFS